MAPAEPRRARTLAFLRAAEFSSRLRQAIFIEGVRAGLRATPVPPNDEEAL